MKATQLVKGDEISFFYEGNGEWITARVDGFRRDTLVAWNLDKGGFRSYSISKIENLTKLQFASVDCD